MDWLQKNYERVLLIAGVAVLLVSAFCIFQRAIGFQSQFADLQSHPVQRPASPPVKANEVNAALEKLRQPPQWTFGGRSGLFVPEKHFIGADGQPATLQTTEVHPPVPNEWIEQFGLPIADADVLEQDPDGDGFNNFDEWQGHTNPVDAKSHPDYLTKLKLKSFSQEPFRLVFASRIEDTFGINTIDLKQPTQFVTIGDTIAGTHFRVAKFTEKSVKDRYGTDEDASELILENTETHEQLTLVKEKVAISPESVATFVYSWRDRKELVVKKDQEFSLPPQGDIRYKLIDVQPTKAVIASSQKPDAPVEIGLLSQ
ncbi:MAG: hypothetical protein DME32_04385 [Verrucomicrobia bacterium]|nr:MAG: hypothetical protein DME32_04385 [Verrucomicrobiota bacterium]